MTIRDTINKAINDSNSKIPNLTRTIAYASQEAYVNAMNDIYKQVGAGKVDYNTALSKTINELAKTGVTIKSETSGRKDRIEVAVRRGLFGSLHQTANDIAKQIGDEIDYNCVSIGHSSTCRPSHNVIDDVVMSKEEFKKYEHLTEEYGCNHIVNYDWLEEFENPNHKKVYGNEHMSYNECKRNYEIQQKARYYERIIRAKKNVVESGNTSYKTKKELQLSRIKYRTFCNSNNLKMSYNRVITPKITNKQRLAYDLKQSHSYNVQTESIIRDTRKLISQTLQNRTKGVSILRENVSYNFYNANKNKIVLGKNANMYSLIHELGHKLFDVLSTEEKAKYYKLIKHKFSKYTIDDFEIINDSTGKYYRLKDSSRFVSKYQSRVYYTKRSFNRDKTVNIEYALEYFSEGLKYYYKKSDLLKQVDKELYDFIDEVIR